MSYLIEWILEGLLIRFHYILGEEEEKVITPPPPHCRLLWKSIFSIESKFNSRVSDCGGGLVIVWGGLMLCIYIGINNSCRMPVSDFTYLGSVVTQNNNLDTEDKEKTKTEVVRWCWRRCSQHPRGSEHDGVWTRSMSGQGLWSNLDWSLLISVTVA